jgi:hypothetical protein
MDGDGDDKMCVRCWHGADATADFVAWFAGLAHASGARPCDPHGMRTVHDICGADIGPAAHSPVESLNAADVGFVVVGTDGDGRCVKCLAAVRLAIASRAVVLDLFGVHASVRRRGVGTRFHGRVMGLVLPVVWSVIGDARPATVSLQSGYDRESYITALLTLSRFLPPPTAALPRSMKAGVSGHPAVFCVDGRELSRRVAGGPCEFWRRMGYDRSEIMFSAGSGFPLVNPLLMMWREIRDENAHSKQIFRFSSWVRRRRSSSPVVSRGWSVSGWPGSRGSSPRKSAGTRG